MNVSIPLRVGERLGPNMWEDLTDDEKEKIIRAAKAIYENYLLGVSALEKAETEVM